MLRRLALAAVLALSPIAAQAQYATIGPTPPVAENSYRLATTAWVNSLIANGLTLASGKIWIGSAGNIATPQTPSGDCTLSLTGVITCTQAAGNFQVIGNLTVGGSIIDGNGILATNIAAPATPAAGTTRIYVDSTQKVLSFKNDAGTVGNAVVPSTCSANQFGTSVSAAGVFGCTQPAITNISGLGTGVATWAATPSSANLRAALTDETGTGLAYFQGGDIGTPSAGVGTNLTALNASNLGSGTVAAARMPALTGDCTTSAGAVATTCTSINNVNQTTAWTTYSPTAAAQTPGVTPPTFTSVTGRYKQIGKTIICQMEAIVNVAGTAAGNLQITLPVASRAGNYAGSAFEAAITGKSGAGIILGGTDTANVRARDATGTTFFANGADVTISIVYEIP